MSLFSSAFGGAIASALAVVNDVCGETVIYCRGNASVSIDATPGASQFVTDDANEIPVGAATRDWIFAAADLVIAGVRTVPQVGDLVKHTVDGTETVYEVLSEGDKPYRFCDRGQTRIRVHTKEVFA